MSDAWPPDTSGSDARPGPPAGLGSGSRSRSGVRHDDPALASGPSVAGYELLEELHRGGQGVVYRALQLGTKREVALKVLLEGPFASESSRRRFEREIELAAALRHPNIVTILDSGLSLGRYYFAMEFISGERLDRYLARHRPPIETTLHLFERICEAVNFAHQRGVLHRDLKPANILVDDAGEPHILDFGLAKHLAAQDPQGTTVAVLSMSGQIIGTVAYMSPEQAAGALDVDVRSDVYSLGVIFYEALVGSPPYAVVGPLGEVLQHIAQDEPANPRSLSIRGAQKDKVDDELATILLKALDKDPQRRYQTAGDLGRDLHHRRLGEPIEAKRASGLYMLRKTLARYRLQAGMAGVLLMMLFGFLITFAVLFTSERDARRQADQKTMEAQAAVSQREIALDQARRRTAEVMQARDELRRALIRQHVQRGDLALARNDLVDARDSYWSAMELSPDPSAIWALRRYYLQTANAGTTLLGFDPGSPAVLSPNGRFAAVCTSPDSIAVQELTSGRTVGWVRAPGRVEHLRVADDGTLAAAGGNWLRAWSSGAERPSLVVTLPEAMRVDVQSVIPIAQGQQLVVIGSERALLFGGNPTRLVQLTFFQGRLIGTPDYSPELRQIAVPTRAGVELLTIGDERLGLQTVWAGSSIVRAVRFVDGRSLAVLTAEPAPASDSATERPGATQPAAPDGEPPVTTGHVLVCPAADLGRPQWTQLLSLPEAYDTFDLRPGGDVVALARRDGHVAVYEHDTPTGAWDIGGAPLVQVCLSVRPPAVVTLDARDTVTHWLPPGRIEQKRRVLGQTPRNWVVAADGSVALFALPRGQVLAYGAADGEAPRTLLRPRLFQFGEDDVQLTVSGDGSRALLLDGSTLRFTNVATGEGPTTTWRDPQFSLAGPIALSDDGTLAALLTHTRLGERQQIVFASWPGGAAAPTINPDDIRPLELTGSEVRLLAFVPGTHDLLIVRSNGQVVRFDPHSPTRPDPVVSAGGKRSSLPVWIEFDAPILRMAFSRSGLFLAAAGDDQIVRLVDRSTGETLRRIVLDHPVRALQFNPRDDALLVRTADGTVRIYTPGAVEPVATWRLPTTTTNPLAAWLGARDTLLLSEDGAVFEHRYDHADELIERNRPFAQQHRVTQDLARGAYGDAWTTALALQQNDPQRGQTLLISVLESALRRPHEVVPQEWLDSVLSSADPATILRLGHAAYEGQRYALARMCLSRGIAALDTPPDAYTQWLRAACDYLADDWNEAADELGDVLAMPDLNRADAPRVALQRVAALTLAGRNDEARRAALAMSDSGDLSGEDIIALTAARVIARYLAGIESERLLDSALEGLLTTFAEQALQFRDDVYFFLGELERRRGDASGATVQYQRCLDLSRDAWPANWARYRLDSLLLQSATNRKNDATMGAS